jgi:hypothetical protein
VDSIGDFDPEGVVLERTTDAVHQLLSIRLIAPQDNAEGAAVFCNVYCHAFARSDLAHDAMDAALAGIPAQCGLEDLANRGQGHDFDDPDVSRCGSRLADFASAMGEQLALGRGRTGSELHVGHRQLAFISIRLADGSRH